MILNTLNHTDCISFYVAPIRYFFKNFHFSPFLFPSRFSIDCQSLTSALLWHVQKILKCLFLAVWISFFLYFAVSLKTSYNLTTLENNQHSHYNNSELIFILYNKSINKSNDMTYFVKNPCPVLIRRNIISWGNKFILQVADINTYTSHLCAGTIVCLLTLKPQNNRWDA